MKTPRYDDYARTVESLVHGLSGYELEVCVGPGFIHALQAKTKRRVSRDRHQHVSVLTTREGEIYATPAVLSGQKIRIADELEVHQVCLRIHVAAEDKLYTVIANAGEVFNHDEEEKSLTLGELTPGTVS